MPEIDFPFEAVVVECEQLVAQGHIVHQKFTCQHCGVRQTMEEPNKFFMTGRCEECSSVTNIRAYGCNYMLIVGAAG